MSEEIWDLGFGYGGLWVVVFGDHDMVPAYIIYQVAPFLKIENLRRQIRLKFHL